MLKLDSDVKICYKKKNVVHTSRYYITNRMRRTEFRETSWRWATAKATRFRLYRDDRV